MRKRWNGAAFLVVTVMAVAEGAMATEGARPPNIVLIVADDLGYADVSFNPWHPSEVRTPNIDALARAGVVCTDGYVTAPVCSPTRAGLMTGRYQQRLGLYTAGQAGSGLPMSERILPQYLAPAGYMCGQFGKWHLGPTPEWSPALRGFDEVFGFLGRGGHDYFDLANPESPIYRGSQPVKESGYLTDRLGDEAVAFIERHKSRPFFCYLAFNAVHTPHQAPADEIVKFHTGSEQRNTILAMGKRMDDAVGRVVTALRKAGVWDNTLLFFISDNGGPLALSANNAPLRGGKHQLFEGGVRVPFVVCWPSRLKPGENRAVVTSLDILPTALAAAGLDPPTARPLDGKNVLPLLKGEIEPAQRDLFWDTGAADGWWAVRSGDWKLVSRQQHVSLFDLGRDLSEERDLAQQEPEKAAALTRLYESWRAQMADPTGRGGRRAARAEGPGWRAAQAQESGTRRPRTERRTRQRAASRPAE